MQEATNADLLEKHFGFREFRPGQEDALNALDAHSAALAVFPTGGGKSLCYQLPALKYEGVTLVVSPLIALMKDQIDFLTGRGIAAARLDSSLTTQEAFAVYDRMEAGTLKLLYVAPERFNNERFLARLGRVKIALFAVDEAHCISEWGHNFRPDYLKLAETARILGVERVLALTATATPSVVKDICKAFQIPKDAAIVTGFYRPNLRLAVTPVTTEARDGILLKRLGARAPGPTIIYVTLQKTAERVAARLSEAGHPAEAYHAGMKDEDRSAVQERWMASDKGIVVATIAFGMGIDKGNVRYVYHYNLPKSLESYSQEIGRARRDGQSSIVEILACPDDLPALENFAYGDTPTESALRGLLDDLLGRGQEFDVSIYDLSTRHDIRQLVLKTTLTYLELRGIIKQGTPFYAGYEVQPLRSLPQIAAEFPGAHGEFILSLFGQARRGSIWYALNPDAVADALGVERKRVVRALEVMEERGLAKIKVADVRSRFSCRAVDTDAESLAAELAAKFEAREAQEIKRLGQVLALLTGDQCLTNALAAYFGEIRDAPCGHCSYCRSGKPAVMPPPTADSEVPFAEAINEPELQSLISANRAALGDARQQARFLCGLTSPAAVRARLSRQPLYGALESRRFHDVLAWRSGE